MLGGTGDDVLASSGAGDLIRGGDGADTIILSADGVTDTLEFDAISEAGDTVRGFDAASQASGGDVIDVADLLDSGSGFSGTVQNAIDQGFLAVVDGAGGAEIRVDVNGGSDFTTVIMVEGVTAADLTDDDNIVVN